MVRLVLVLVVGLEASPGTKAESGSIELPNRRVTARVREQGLGLVE